MVNPALATRYQYDYNRFADWCAAHGHTPIPADPSVVGQYLAAAPAAPSTQRGRLSAINWAHRNAGFPAPGRAPRLRESLNSARAARTTRLHGLIEAVLPNLPIWGWPAGLFGRRDAALLHLTRSGLPFPLIAGLTRGEVTIGTDHVEIGTGPLVVLHASDDPAGCPVVAFQRWAAVLDIVHRPTATYLLERHLEQETLPDPTPGTTTEGPLLFAFDRDGNPALKPSPLTPGSIGVITAAHILGRTPAHRPRKRRRHNDDSPDSGPAFEDQSPPLSNEYFDRGTAARRRGLESMADIEALLDAAEAEADRVLAAWR
ncbi:recombinase [Nocardia brasiliensis]|uniref:recombinase n=1 Tax=Nocardia brasiliensis TaxID=37326 RepID=UPI00245795A5|nr:recombinase [Nocardia brasiliensis]